MDDLSPELEAPITQEERIAAAQAAVRSFCGWHVAPIITEVVDRYELAGDAILLPTMRLHNVVSITAADGNDLVAGARVWGETSGMIHRYGGWPPACDGPLQIEIKHGYSPEEAADVINVVKQAAARAAGSPTAPDSERAGPFQRSWREGGSRVGVSLLNAEIAKLEPYRLTWGP